MRTTANDQRAPGRPGLQFLGTDPVDVFLAGLREDSSRTYHVHIQEALGFLDRPTRALMLAFLQSMVDSDHTRHAYARHLKDAFRIMGLIMTLVPWEIRHDR